MSQAKASAAVQTSSATTASYAQHQFETAALWDKAIIQHGPQNTNTASIAVKISA